MRDESEAGSKKGKKSKNSFFVLFALFALSRNNHARLYSAASQPAVDSTRNRWLTRAVPYRCSDLEFDSRSQLDCARIEHAGSAAKAHICPVCLDSTRVHIDAIEQIVEFGAELEARAFLAIKPGDAEASPEAEIHKLQSGPPECVAA